MWLVTLKHNHKLNKVKLGSVHIAHLNLLQLCGPQLQGFGERVLLLDELRRPLPVVLDGVLTLGDQGLQTPHLHRTSPAQH